MGRKAIRGLRLLLLIQLGQIPMRLAIWRSVGVWDYFYEYRAHSSEVSTYHVNLPHVWQLKHPLDLAALPADQHSAWRWQDMKEAAVAEDVHPYVRVYAQWLVDQSTDRVS